MTPFLIGLGVGVAATCFVAAIIVALFVWQAPLIDDERWNR